MLETYVPWTALESHQDAVDRSTRRTLRDDRVGVCLSNVRGPERSRRCDLTRSERTNRVATQWPTCARKERAALPPHCQPLPERNHRNTAITAHFSPTELSPNRRQIGELRTTIRIRTALRRWSRSFGGRYIYPLDVTRRYSFLATLRLNGTDPESGGAAPEDSSYL